MRRRVVRRTPLPSMKELRKKHSEGFFLKKAEETVESAKEEIKEEIAEVVEKVSEVVEKVSEVVEETVESLEDLTKDALLSKAKELGIAAKKNWSKKTLISKIKEK